MTVSIPFPHRTTSRPGPPAKKSAGAAVEEVPPSLAENTVCPWPATQHVRARAAANLIGAALAKHNVRSFADANHVIPSPVVNVVGAGRPPQALGPPTA